MAERDELIKVFEAHEVLDENDLVVGRQLFRVAARECGVDLLDICQLEIIDEALDEVDENLSEHGGIVARAMVIKGL